MSSQYDDFIRFKVEAERQIQELSSRVNEISILCDHIRKSIEASEVYSYQFNIKIVGVPTVAEREISQQTADLCMTLFAALEREEVSLSDIDTAHRMPSRVACNRPNSIICKFVRRLARENVMAARRGVSNLNAEDLGFSRVVVVSHINIYDHLTPRLQELLFESKKFKDANSYKYCWAKNGFFHLQKTNTSTTIKLSSLEDLQGVAS